MGLMCLMGMGFRTDVCGSQYKAHSCMHMVLMSEFMNPRMVWCFDGETFMGVMRLLGEACNKSCTSAGIPSTNLLMRRYVLGLHLLMDDPDLLLWRSARWKEMQAAAFACMFLMSLMLVCSYARMILMFLWVLCFLCSYDSCRWSLCSYVLICSYKAYRF